MMEMTDVTSTNIASVGYDHHTREMRVFFKKGGRYTIRGIEPEVYENFLKAESPGSFYARHIRGHYKYAKIETDEG